MKTKTSLSIILILSALLLILLVISLTQTPLLLAREIYTEGTVTDKLLANPIKGAIVKMGEQSFITQDDGRYAIELPETKNEITVTVFKEGYYEFRASIPPDKRIYDIELSKVKEEELPSFTEALNWITKKGINMYTYASSNPEHSLISVEVFGRNTNDFDIWLMTPEGVKINKEISTKGADGNPRWSPDGTKIVFHSEIPTLGYKIYLWDFETEEIKEVDHGLTPVWSPNGEKIIYAKPDQEGKWHLWIKDLKKDAPSERIPIELTGKKLYPDWGPDGKVVFSRKKDKQIFEIWQVKPDGSELTRLTSRTSPGKELGPVWSPDGLKIAYWLIEPGQPHSIWLMNQDGTQQALWLKEAANPTWIPNTSDLIFEGKFTGVAQIWEGNPLTNSEIKEQN